MPAPMHARQGEQRANSASAAKQKVDRHLPYASLRRNGTVPAGLSASRLTFRLADWLAFRLS
jgi:hypothetical protein